MGVELTTDEAWSFIEQAHTCSFTTLRRDGSPVTTPMWFVVIDRAIYLRTLARSPKIRNLRQDPRISFVVEAGKAWAELTAVIVSGTATFVDDPAVRELIDAELARRYAGFMVPDDVPSATRKHYADDLAYVRIDPDRPFQTWNNSKIRRRSS